MTKFYLIAKVSGGFMFPQIVKNHNNDVAVADVCWQENAGEAIIHFEKNGWIEKNSNYYTFSKNALAVMSCGIENIIAA